MNRRPDRAEAAEYYFKYIDRVLDGDIRDLLETQGRVTLATLEQISEDQASHRYADGKWSVRQVLGHVNDCERLFVARAFWFARGFDSPLPSFDQDIAMRASGADERSWASHVAEFRSVRAASNAFFRHLPADAWNCRGTASGNVFSVRALAYVAAGHELHHLALLKERYLGNHA
jgi:hypothetical protein